MRKSALIIIFAFFLGGCASMGSHEKYAYRQIEDVGAPCKTVAEPGTAAALNLFPGFGDIYLATGEGANSSNWGAFALDLLLWPISVVWAIPQGAITANEINKIECIGYYTYTAEGKAELERLKQQHNKSIKSGPIEEPKAEPQVKPDPDATQ